MIYFLYLKEMMNGNDVKKGFHRPDLSCSAAAAWRLA